MAKRNRRKTNPSKKKVRKQGQTFRTNSQFRTTVERFLESRKPNVFQPNNIVKNLVAQDHTQEGG